jgi:hypothetical protein
MDKLFAEKCTILGKFKSATVALRDALDSEDAGAIDALLTERRQCIDLVNRIDSAIGSATMRQKSEEGLCIEIRELLAEIVPLDLDCHDRMQSQVRELRAAAANLSHSSSPFSRGALTKQNTVPRFLDIRT